MGFDMASRLSPTALKLMEDCLADAFYSHHDLDSFLIRCGAGSAFVGSARSRAEDRKGRYERAPKRFVAQELLRSLEENGQDGVYILVAIFDALVKGQFPDANEKGKQALASLKAQFEKDRDERIADEQARAKWKASQAEASRESPSKPKRQPGEIPRLLERFLTLQGAADPHQRGRDFEILVVDLLKAEALSPRHSIERVGEQIDISFEFGPHTYLVETRWKKSPSEPKELRDFHGKCQGVHVDVRGLFLSVEGFTAGCAEALVKVGELRIVMLDGSHLMAVLSGAISFPDLLKAAVRKACDEGTPYVPAGGMGKGA
jgi:hypothetical protein